MTILNRLFQSLTWKVIVLLFVSVLLIALLRMLFTLDEALRLLSDLSAYRGVRLPSEITEIIGVGKIAGAILAILGIVSLIDLLTNLKRVGHYKRITTVIKRFADGELNLRAPEIAHSDIGQLSTAFNSMADTVEMSINKLKSVDELRRELVANVAHDLGGPVTSIRGFVETVLLKGESLSKEERNSHLSVVLSNTKALSKLVAELFDLSKLDSNIVELKREPFSIETLANDVASRFWDHAQKRKIKVEVATSEDLPLVIADIALMERAISNIIENSIKYSKDDSKVVIRITREEGGVLVSITDFGSGIPQADIPYIFDRFYRVGKDRSRSSGGAGLGLAIVKKILDLHSIPVDVKSTLGQGTMVSFILPISK